MPKNFWDDATAASRRELGVRSPEQVITSNRSACAELPPASRVKIDGAGAVLAGLLILTLVLFVAAVVLAVLAWTGGLGPTPRAWLWPASALVGSVVTLALSFGQEKRFFDRIAPLPVAGFNPMLQEPVGIEPAESYQNFKLFADDLAILYHDPANGRLLLVSTTHCCCLCDADVIALTKGEGANSTGSGVRVDARVGSTQLSIAISARKNLFDGNNLDRPYDPKGYFMERLLRTLKAQELGPQAVGPHGFEVIPEDDDA